MVFSQDIRLKNNILVQPVVLSHDKDVDSDCPLVSDYHGRDEKQQITIITPGGVALSYTLAGLFYSEDFVETNIDHYVGSLALSTLVSMIIILPIMNRVVMCTA